MKRVILLSTVSAEEQAKGHAVGLGQQEADFKALAERNDWQITNHFMDCKNSNATLLLKKGQIVNQKGGCSPGSVHALYDLTGPLDGGIRLELIR